MKEHDFQIGDKVDIKRTDARAKNGPGIVQDEFYEKGARYYRVSFPSTGGYGVFKSAELVLHREK